MIDLTKNPGPPGAGRDCRRFPRSLTFALAGLTACAGLGLLGAPALSADDGGQTVTVKTVKAPAKDQKVKTEAKTKTREVVVIAEPGDEPDGGVWMTKELGGGYLGVELLPLTKELRTHFGAPADQGVLVSRVEDGSPAAKAGLRPGDVITRFDGDAVKAPWDLTLAVRGHDKGDTARLDLLRDGKPLGFDVQIEERERQKIDVGKLLELRDGPGDDDKTIVRLRELARPGEGPPVVYFHPDAMDRLGESLDKVDWPRLNERLGQRNRELEKRIDELEKRLDDLEKELNQSKGKPR